MWSFLRKMLPLLLFLSPPVLRAQQYLNAGFEEWQDLGSYEDPQGWSTNNLDAGVSVSKTTDSFTGQYAARIEAGFPTFEGDAPGILSMAIPAVNGVPSHLKVHLKFTELEDTARAAIQLESFSGSTYDVQEIWTTQTAVSDWMELSLNLTYPWSEASIDSVRISFIAGSIVSPLGFMGNGTLFIDNLRLEGVNTSVSHLNAADPDFQLYPNPAAAELTVDLRQMPLGWYQLSLCDMYGRTVLSMPDVSNYARVHIPVSQLPAGTYLFLAESEGLHYQRRFIIAR